MLIKKTICKVHVSQVRNLQEMIELLQIVFQEMFLICSSRIF